MSKLQEQISQAEQRSKTHHRVHHGIRKQGAELGRPPPVARRACGPSSAESARDWLRREEERDDDQIKEETSEDVKPAPLEALGKLGASLKELGSTLFGGSTAALPVVAASPSVSDSMV